MEAELRGLMEHTAIPPRLSFPLTVAVTGHRDILHPDEAVSSAAVFFHTLANNHPNTPLRLLSGLAEGGDRIAAHAFQIARRERMARHDRTAADWTFVPVLPMNPTAYRQDFPDSIAEFDALLAEATAVIVLPSPSAEELDTNQDKRIDCYEALGRHLAKHSNVVMALWDGMELDARGGTSHVVRMKLNGMEGHGYRHVSGLHDCGPVWHIPVRRCKNTVVGVEAHGHWIYPSELALTRAVIDDAFRQIDCLNEALANEVADKAAQSATMWLSPSPEASSDLLSGLGIFERQHALLQGAVDTLAMSRDKKRAKLTLSVYACAAAVAFFLWSALDGVFQIAMACGYLMSLALAFAFYRRAKRPELSESPLDYRFLAEALRVHLYWSLAHAREPRDNSERPVSAPILAAPRILEGLLSQQAHEIGWLREALRSCALDPAGYDTVPETLQSAHINHWIQDQFAYFRKTETRYIRLSAMLKKLSLAGVVLGLAAAAATLTLDLSEQNSPIVRHCMSIAAAVLPTVAVLIQSYGDRLAIEEQAKSALRMQWVFERAQSYLARHATPSVLPIAMVRSLGEEALTECANWLVLRKSKPPSMPT